MPSDNYIFNSAPENMIIFAAFSIYISREAPLTVIFTDKNTYHLLVGLVILEKEIIQQSRIQCIHTLQQEITQ
jgi:hypothetical protein